MKTRLIRRLLVVVLTTLPLHSLPASEDWNDELVKEVIEKHEITVYSGDDAKGAEKLFQDALKAELYVESERLSRSGVRVLKRNDQLEGLPGVLQKEGVGTYFETESITAPDGTPLFLTRIMSPHEVVERKLENSPTPPEQVAAMMSTMSDMMLALGATVRDEIDAAGFGGLLGNEDAYIDGIADGKGGDLCNDLINSRGRYKGKEDDYWRDESEAIRLTGISTKTGQLHPVMYTFGPACMLAVSAQSLNNIEKPSPGQYAAAEAEAIRKAMQSIEFYGYKFYGCKARPNGCKPDDDYGGITLHYKIVDPPTYQSDPDVDIENISIWIDPQYFKRTKFRVEGTMRAQGEKRKFFMERENQDYRRVDNTYLYEPYLQIVRMGGVLSEKERKELEKAQKELEKAEAQLASMPATQRKMMERMMGKQMEQLRQLAQDGSVEMRIVTTSIEINPEFEFTGMSGNVSPDINVNASLIQLVQGYLAELGYEPGPATGELTTETVIAVSQYQAEKGLEVTGEITAELAERLQQEVADT